MRTIQFALSSIAASILAISPVAAPAKAFEEDAKISLRSMVGSEHYNKAIEGFEAMESFPGFTEAELKRFKEVRRTVSQIIEKQQKSGPSLMSDAEFEFLLKQYADFLYFSARGIGFLQQAMDRNSEDSDRLASSSLLLGSIHFAAAVGGTIGAFHQFSQLKLPVSAKSKAGRVFTRIGQAGGGSISSIIAVLAGLITYGYFSTATSYPDKIREENRKLMDLVVALESLRAQVAHELETTLLILEVTK